VQASQPPAAQLLMCMQAHLRGHDADAPVVSQLGHELLRTSPASKHAVSKILD